VDFKEGVIFVIQFRDERTGLYFVVCLCRQAAAKAGFVPYAVGNPKPHMEGFGEYHHYGGLPGVQQITQRNKSRAVPVFVCLLIKDRECAFPAHIREGIIVATANGLPGATGKQK
jgi:hypothetical protein